jgi:hypothetical protein
MYDMDLPSKRFIVDHTNDFRWCRSTIVDSPVEKCAQNSFAAGLH